MLKINKILIISTFLSIAVLGMGSGNFVVFAQTTTATTTASQLQELINNLQSQIQTLQEQLTQIGVQRQEIRQTITEIIFTLKEGDRNENVKTLQALLAADSDIYPEGLITGFYGALTKNAVKKFQKKHGLETVGFVGPKTKIKLNELLRKNPLAIEGTSTSTTSGVCAIVPPGHLIAPGWLKKQNGIKPIVPACQILPLGIAKKLTSATSTPTTTPDTIQPVISGINATSTTATSTSIVWTTNELSDGKIWYSTSTPISATGTPSISTSTLSLSHQFGLLNLIASSTYHFIVGSTDAANNTATSGEQSFTTLSQ